MKLKLKYGKHPNSIGYLYQGQENTKTDSDRPSLTGSSISVQVDRKANTPLTPAQKAMLACSPTLNNAAVIESLQANLMGRDVDLSALVVQLKASVKEVKADDLSFFESMLVGQAASLQSIFACLARKAVAQETMPQYQTYLGLALKAQAQCRTTIAALVDLKLPRQTPLFSQTNTTTGLQQVNNHFHSSSDGVTPEDQPNQLSGS